MPPLLKYLLLLLGPYHFSPLLCPSLHEIFLKYTITFPSLFLIFFLLILKHLCYSQSQDCLFKKKKKKFPEILVILASFYYMLSWGSLSFSICVWVSSVLTHVCLFLTPWTLAHCAPLFMGFPRQECWSGLPFPSPGDLPDSGIDPTSPALQADSYHLSHQKHLTMCIYT